MLEATAKASWVLWVLTVGTASSRKREKEQMRGPLRGSDLREIVTEWMRDT